ncbi:CoxG family protein [Niallia taxi]|uniref:SRPBCC family protein n=1 Tax=Niallia taxi TaxID=2499688 RepID=A0A3S2U759_9BACI|nr:SRPBCC family protein [Niallia taxi]MCM3214292.1 SRPBCC family protein [Niallia taxi]MDK8641071.1 SRPBCC family protein [Niallia taxi]MED4038144.1 SRPBCC family protein [Niallia taxi]MED4052670.1 SRPBCC family protein [Niallia taxi]MED4120025.1 SRPBCC family protein [Niallia taxi]
MPSKKHSVVVKAPLEKVWDFVRSMDNWAPLVPGYIQHQIISDLVSTWEFKTDIGFIKKKISLRIDILKWEEPSQVSFKLTGINEKFIGSGYFSAQQVGEMQTKMTGYLEINAFGTFAPMVNSVLEPKLDEITQELTIEVCKAIEQR